MGNGAERGGNGAVTGRQRGGNGAATGVDERERERGRELGEGRHGRVLRDR